MSNLVCPKCNKEFKTNPGFNKHIERKICSKKKQINKAIELCKQKNLEENQTQTNSLNILKAISLFSGMGGDSLGIHNSNIDLVAYSELDSIFQKSHDLNFPKCELIGNGNILKTDDSDFLKYKGLINLLFAGFPCQGFSHAGKKLPDDPRNTLFREFLRATKLIEPDYIIGENVKGLLSRKTIDDELFIDIITSEFDKLGYNIYTKVLKANQHGVPQNRHRLFIVGIKKTVSDKNFTFPIEETGELDLKNIVKFDMTGSILIEPEDFDMTTIPEECILTDLNNDETTNKPHPYLIELAKKRDFLYNGVNYPNRLSFGIRSKSVYGEIIDIRKPINTIISTYSRQPRFFVPLKNKNGYFLRCLLPEELKQIQGFPIDYQLSGNITQQIVQIGNAVPPLLVEKIINNIINIDKL